MSEFFLRGKKNRNEGGPLDWIVPDDRVEFRKELIGNHEVEQAIQGVKRVFARSNAKGRVLGCRFQ
jgi:hypothetical protein